MRYGSLFSGAGLGDFGFEMAGLELAWQVEYEPYCRKILDLRWPEVKKYGNIKEVNTDELEPVELITGGFPCQPFSVAGKRKGKDDNRYLWPEMLRIIKAKKPTWVVGENVPGIINLALDTVCSDLEAESYEVWPVVFPSHALGAWHKRDRLWIIAHSEHNGRIAAKRLGTNSGTQSEGKARKKLSVAELERVGGLRTQDAGRETMANPVSDSKRTTFGKGIQRNTNNEQDNRNKIWSDIRNGSETFRRFWEFESGVGRVANGCPNRVDRLKALGNGQTPCSTYVIGKLILELEKGE